MSDGSDGSDGSDKSRNPPWYIITRMLKGITPEQVGRGMECLNICHYIYRVMRAPLWGLASV